MVFDIFYINGMMIFERIDEDFNTDFYFDNVYQNFTLTIFMRILP